MTFKKSDLDKLEDELLEAHHAELNDFYDGSFVDPIR